MRRLDEGKDSALTWGGLTDTSERANRPAIRQERGRLNCQKSDVGIVPDEERPGGGFRQGKAETETSVSKRESDDMRGKQKTE